MSKTKVVWFKMWTDLKFVLVNKILGRAFYVAQIGVAAFSIFLVYQCFLNSSKYLLSNLQADLFHHILVGLLIIDH